MRERVAEATLVGEFFYRTSVWVIYLASVCIFVGATAAGFSVGRRAGSRTDDRARSQVTTIQAAVLGIMGLLLGFSFAMAESRYDTRKQLVLDEANAIWTTYLRARLLPQPHAREATKLLRRYVDVRLEFYSAGIDTRRVRGASVRTEQLQQALWSHAVAAGRIDPRSVSTGLFTQSLNDVIDIDSKRLTALRNHVPGGVFLILYFTAAVSMSLTGYAFGLAGCRDWLTTLTASVLIAAVIVLIVDLDRPRRGLIRVSQQSMIKLRKNLAGPVTYK